jgi:hypothetical protein
MGHWPISTTDESPRPDKPPRTDKPRDREASDSERRRRAREHTP